MFKLITLMFCVVVTTIATTASAAKVVIIGDSMFSESPVKQFLEDWSSVGIDNYAVTGASLQEGWVKSIPEQYEEIKGMNLSTIIMDGGGNDVFSNLYECQQFSDKCKEVINNVANIAKSLITEMGNNNVSDVIYLGFFYVKGLNKAIDYGTQKLKHICENITTTNCYFSDPRNITIPVGWDGVHPTREGYELLSNRIWDTILDNDVVI